MKETTIRNDLNDIEKLIFIDEDTLSSEELLFTGDMEESADE